MRRFSNAGIPTETIERLLHTACRAPSAHNRQPWRFAVVANRDARAALADAMGAEFRRDLLQDGLSAAEADRLVARSRDRLVDAPVAVVLCLTMAGMDAYPDRARQRAEFRMAMQSVALAGGQLMLAAHAEGLGSVWVCAPLFAPTAVRLNLDLPTDWEPQAMILLGFPDPDRPERPRDRVPHTRLTVYR